MHPRLDLYDAQRARQLGEPFEHAGAPTHGRGSAPATTTPTSGELCHDVGADEPWRLRSSPPAPVPRQAKASADSHKHKARVKHRVAALRALQEAEVAALVRQAGDESLDGATVGSLHPGAGDRPSSRRARRHRLAARSGPGVVAAGVLAVASGIGPQRAKGVPKDQQLSYPRPRVATRHINPSRFRSRVVVLRGVDAGNFARHREITRGRRDVRRRSPPRPRRVSFAPGAGHAACTSGGCSTEASTWLIAHRCCVRFDFSNPSRAALRYATAIAERFRMQPHAADSQRPAAGRGGRTAGWPRMASRR